MTTASAVLDREFLEIRAKLLEVAASLDRLERAAGSVEGDPRLERIRQAIELLADESGRDRAEAIQLLFSRQYDPNWQQVFGMGGAAR